MSFSWGSTDLYVIPDTYNPPWAEVTINEIALLPDPADLNAVSTVLQQGGRKRQIVTLSTYVKTYSTYTAMLADCMAGTQRTFTGADSYSATMIISNISQAARKIYPTRFEFSVTFMEV
jgi:hypothetical protein